MEDITWKFTQENSDSILSDGIYKLKTSPINACNEINYESFGNYLISNENTIYYIGEGKELCKRIKQQFKLNTSTFYKNFTKFQKTNHLIKSIAIEAFKVQIIPTEIGRKEIEEIGICCLPTLVNHFQMDKRKKQEVKGQNGLWEKVQKLKSEIIIEAEQEVMRGSFRNWYDCKVKATAGLYLVENQSRDLIYIGESSDIYERYNTHSTRTYFSALRRHIATEILEFSLQERNGKKKYLEIEEDREVTDFLKSCKASFYPTTFGRYELEEYLIKKHRPLLNRKDNKKV